MRRLLLAVATLIALIAFSATNLTIRSNVDAVFGQNSSGKALFDTSASRDLIVLVRADSIAQRNVVARTVAAHFSESPLIESTNSGPVPPSGAFQDWIWENRFHLAPPTQDHFALPSMVSQLDTARKFFSNIDSMALGDRLLLDPTGSYWRTIQRLEGAATQLSSIGGVWQANDGSAAVLHVTFVKGALAAEDVHALTQSVRSLAQAGGAFLFFLGVPTIAAETTLANYQASLWASLLAGVLLVAWLIWSLRSAVSIGFVFLPLALGLGTAFFTVQLTFGYVHVIAMGFGGALLGLALDYPIHIIGHARSARPKTYRLVLLGAMTTSIAFVAMIGSGVPALAQTGVFVASGLTAAAIVSVSIPPPLAPKIHGFSLRRLIWQLPHKHMIEVALIIAGTAFVFFTNKEAAITLFEPPQAITDEIGVVSKALDLPSGKYALMVHGNDLNALLAHEAKLAPILDAAIKSGSLRSYAMLSQLLPATLPYLPTAKAFQASAQNALIKAGMSAEFAVIQTETYAKARSVPRIQYDDLLRFPETRSLAERLLVTKDGWSEKILLLLPDGAGFPAFNLSSPNVEVVDLLEPIRETLTTIQKQVTIWLLGGLCIGVCLLAFGLHDWKTAWRILRTSCAVIAVTASVLVAIYGALSIFHIVAMALVVGIGMDYGIFFIEMKNEANEKPETSSIALCASSTLIAFFVLCFSEVQILHQIGVTVVVGLLLMLLLTLAQTKEPT